MGYCSGIVHDQWTRFDGLSPDKFMIAMPSSGSKKNADGDCKLAVEALLDSNLSSNSVSRLVYNKITLFSLSKFQYISDSLHSCTNRQNIQSHCFNSLVPRTSFPDPLKPIAPKPHRMKSQSLGPFCSSYDQVNARLLPFLVQHFLRVSRLLECLNG